MRRFIICGLFAAIALALAVPAMAQSQGDDKYVGIGFIVGEPTGLDAKFFLNNEHALEFGLAWDLNGQNELHLQGDYLWHRYGLIDLKNGDEMPLFFGIGARFVATEDDPGDNHNDDDVFGIRFPVGLAYMFTNYPFDIFMEIVPILDLTPDSDFDLEGALGARFWF
jgi:hypothetical protein